MTPETLSKLPVAERWLSVDWWGGSEVFAEQLQPVVDAFSIRLRSTRHNVERAVRTEIKDTSVSLTIEPLTRLGAILIVYCDTLHVNSEDVDIYVLGEAPEIPCAWRNCLFVTDRGLRRLAFAFAAVVLGWADEYRRGALAEACLRRSDGRFTFRDEHRRLAQERVFFFLQHPPLERGRLLWIYANPYADLLAGPYGLEILDDICREAGFVTRITNPFLEFLHPIEGMQALLKDFQPDLIGISLRNIDDALIVHTLEGEPESIDTLDLLTEVHHLVQAMRSFERPIFMGGAAFGTAPELFLRYFDLEFGVIGAGEAAIEELCALWQREAFQEKGMEEFRRLWSALPNAVWKEEDGWKRNPARQSRLLEQTPLIRRTWTYTYKNRRDFMPEPVRGAQGCSLGCSYCVESVNRKAMSWRSVQQVVDEIEFSFRRYGIRLFHLADSEANIPFPRLVELAEELIARKLHEELLWTAYLNVRPFDVQLIGLLRRSGLYRFKFALDHFDDGMLRSYHKNFREKDIENLLAGFEPYYRQVQLYAGILLGGPGESEESLHYAIRRMKEHARRGCTFYYNVGVRVYPGTPLGEQFLAHPEASGYYGPGRADGGLRPLVYCSPQPPRLLARRLENIFAEDKRVFRMNKERTLAIGYEGYRRFIVAWHAWLNGHAQEAERILAETEGLHLLREGVVLQRLLRMRKRSNNPFSYPEEEVIPL